jgi:acetate kinase
MDGLDVLVFTGGVGENSPEIRSRAAGGLSFLGVAVDETRNTLERADRGGEDWEITAPRAAARTFVIAAREDRQIAGEVRSLLPSL